MAIARKIPINSFIYFVMGFMLPVHFGKLFGNLSPFDVILICAFITDRRNIYKYIFSGNLEGLFKVSALIYLMLTCLSFVHILQFSNHFKYLFQYLFCIFVALPVFIFSFSPQRLNSIVSGIILGSFIAFTLVLLIYFEQAPKIIYKLFDLQTTGRVRVGLAGVNDYAICLTAALTYITLGSGKSSPIKIVSILMLLILVGATGSRVGIVLALFVIFWSFGIRSWKFNIFSIVVITMILLKIKPENNPVFRIVKFGFNDAQRSDMTSRALALMEINPYGIGMGNYIDSIAGYPVHNFFVINLLEQGLILGSIFLLPILLIFLSSAILSKSFGHFIFIFIHFAGFAVVTHAFDRFFWIIPALGLSATLRKYPLFENSSGMKKL
tara:strand:+ start:1644 stop:2789 length:1146 start_codon:yes stop_codon:yes gene_type:complete